MAWFPQVALVNKLLQQSLYSRLENLALKQKYPSVIWYELYFNISNRLGMIHECDTQTDGQTLPQQVSCSTIRCAAENHSRSFLLNNVLPDMLSVVYVRKNVE